MINYNSYSIEECEHLYGPGRRLVLFTQGCSIHCPGCINAHMWAFNGGKSINVSQIIEMLDGCEGLTLLGGEPLDQDNTILELIKAVKQKDKTIVLFTGYLYKELTKAYQRKAWELSDIVISGRFDLSKRNVYLQFRGSTNQRVYMHKGKYKQYRLTDGESVAIIKIKPGGEAIEQGFYTHELAALIKELKIGGDNNG